MGSTLLEDAQRHLEHAMAAREWNDRIYHIREAQQVLIAAEQKVDIQQPILQ